MGTRLAARPPKDRVGGSWGPALTKLHGPYSAGSAAVGDPSRSVPPFHPATQQDYIDRLPHLCPLTHMEVDHLPRASVKTCVRLSPATKHQRVVSYAPPTARTRPLSRGGGRGHDELEAGCLEPSHALHQVRHHAWRAGKFVLLSTSIISTAGADARNPGAGGVGAGRPLARAHTVEGRRDALQPLVAHLVKGGRRQLHRGQLGERAVCEADLPARAAVTRRRSQPRAGGRGGGGGGGGGTGLSGAGESTISRLSDSLASHGRGPMARSRLDLGSICARSRLDLGSDLG